MDVQIRSLLEGAQQAQGSTVLIDVFRASNTIIACLASGAQYVIPVGSLKEARRYKSDNPDYLLFGERKGLPPEGFDYGNSPAQAMNLDLRGKVVILTTSAGSRGIVDARDAKELLIGSFANADAIVDYLMGGNPEQVTLVPIGFESVKKAEEDEACAYFLKERLEGRTPNFLELERRIRASDGAARLRRLKQEDDLEFALRLNTHPVTPFYHNGRLLVGARTEPKQSPQTI